MAALLWRRQQDGNAAFGDGGEYTGNADTDYDGYDSWWWSPAGMAVRYGIVALLFGSILLFLIGGYYTTQRRIQRGQEPRPLFRWMVRTRRQPYYHAQQQQYQQNPLRQPHRAHHYDPNSQGYGMEGYPAPPPPYSNGEMPPPVYQPPQGASKALPDQNVRGVSGTGEASSSAGVEQPPPVARQ